MPDRVHLTMNDVEPPGAQSVLDRPAAEPERHELAVRDVAVLAVGEGRDPGIRGTRVTFGMHDMRIVTRIVLHGAVALCQCV